MAETMIINFEDAEVREIEKAKKIKLKPLSYANIKMRTAFTQPKIEETAEQNENTVSTITENESVKAQEIQQENTTIQAQNLNPENQMLDKISKIEANHNISFIDENITTQSIADYRAIKLNGTMFTNVKNKSDIINNNVQQQVEDSFAEEAAKLDSNLQNIEVASPVNDIPEVALETVDQEDTKDTVNEEFTSQENYVQSENETAEEIQMEQENSNEVEETQYEEVTYDEADQTYNNEISVVKPIEFKPIPKLAAVTLNFNPSQEIMTENTASLNDDIFGARTVEEENTQSQEDTREVPIYTENEDFSQRFDRAIDEFNNNAFESDYSKDTSTENYQDEEGLTFDYSDATPNDLANAIESTNELHEVQAIKNRINILKQEERRMDETLESLAREEEEANLKYEETVKQFSMFGDALEQSCNAKQKLAKEKSEATNIKLQEINQMLEAMGLNASETEEKRI